jgi:hypothetical protein
MNMTEGNLARNIEQDPEAQVAPAVKPAVTLTAVPSDQPAEAATQDQTSLARSKRVRGIVWDDGGLKPFRLG